MSVKVNYKGSQLTTVDAQQTKTLETAGTWCEDDITIANDNNPVAEDNDVIFIDYDGTIRYSYTANEFLALTELPPNPKHAGLTAQGWNWTLADAKDYVSVYGGQIIGQNYVTADGKTRLYVNISKDFLARSLRLALVATVVGGISIDWGDGSSPDTNTAANARRVYSHTYLHTGRYVITITVSSGQFRFAGGYINSTITNTADNGDLAFCVEKIEIGAGTVTNTISYACFKQFRVLKTITVPRGITDYNTNYIMEGCNRLECFVMPPGSNQVGSQMIRFSRCKFVSIPKTVTVLSSYCFQESNRTYKLFIPDAVTTVKTYALDSSLVSLILPQSITKLEANSLRNTYFVHLRSTTPPTLDNVNAFNDVKCIYVPYSADHSILNAYKTATNWAGLASYIQEEPQ